MKSSPDSTNSQVDQSDSAKPNDVTTNADQDHVSTDTAAEGGESPGIQLGDRARNPETRAAEETDQAQESRNPHPGDESDDESLNSIVGEVSERMRGELGLHDQSTELIGGYAFPRQGFERIDLSSVEQALSSADIAELPRGAGDLNEPWRRIELNRELGPDGYISSDGLSRSNATGSPGTSDEATATDVGVYSYLDTETGEYVFRDEEGTLHRFKDRVPSEIKDQFCAQYLEPVDTSVADMTPNPDSPFYHIQVGVEGARTVVCAPEDMGARRAV